jgi:hypothetical protein
MAKITALDVVEHLTGDEFLPIVQGASTRRATMTSLRALIVPFLQYWYKGERGIPGGNVMSVGLRTEVDADMSIPDGVGCIQFSGFRRHGQGPHQMFLWDASMEPLDPVGKGMEWITTNGGAKTWFIPSDEGTPEMLGAFADDGRFSANSANRGNDDWPYLQRAVNYFNLIRLPGKYRSSKCINVLRTVMILGRAGAEAGIYTTRVRFDRGCVGWFFHRYNTNADETGKTPFIQTRATTASADGFMIANIEIVMGQADRIPYDGSNLTEHSIWHKCRGVMQYLRIRGTMGHAIYGRATAVSTNPFVVGNANGSTVSVIRAEQLTGSPLWWEGADMNASRSTGVNGAMHGGPCIGEFGFLGNVHETPQTANAGRDGLVYYGGFRWWCIDPTLASTQAPGTGSAWLKGDATTQADDWVSGKPYLHGGSYVSGSNTGRVVWVNPYTEGGSGPLVVTSAVDTQTWVIGGLLSGDAGGIYGNCGYLGPTGARIYGRNGLAGASLAATGGVSGLGAQATLHNTGNIGTSRGSALQVNVGYEADGVTPHPVARYAARSGANASVVGEMQSDLWNPATSTWETKLLVQSAAVLPGADNAIDLGSGPRRFRQIFGATPTINTSDERAKADILPIDDALLDAWADVEWRQFRMVDAIEAKGDEARIHTGVIAQQVRDALLAHGIDGTRYGLLCFDRWDEEWEEWEDEYEERAAVYAFDEDNRHVFDGDEPVVETPAGRVLVREAGRKLIRAAGELWGVRYTEAFAVEAAYQRRRMDRIEAKLAA